MTIDQSSPPVAVFSNAAVHPLWEGLSLDVHPGEFITVLGPNGSGKSTLLNVLLKTRALTAGTATVHGRVGYIPQQRLFPPDLPLRARDLVGLAAKHGILTHRRPDKAKVAELLATVGATGLADRRLGTLSGGQQQLVRQAQALATNPDLLLLDEPLLSLDRAAAHRTLEILNERRKKHGTAIIFVTHTTDSGVLPATDRVLYLAPYGHAIGTVDEVMTSEKLSKLYNTTVDVVRVKDKLVVI